MVADRAVGLHDPQHEHPGVRRRLPDQTGDECTVASGFVERNAAGSVLRCIVSGRGPICLHEEGLAIRRRQPRMHSQYRVCDGVEHRDNRAAPAGKVPLRSTRGWTGPYHDRHATEARVSLPDRKGHDLVREREGITHPSFIYVDVYGRPGPKDHRWVLWLFRLAVLCRSCICLLGVPLLGLIPPARRLFWRVRHRELSCPCLSIWTVGALPTDE